MGWIAKLLLFTDIHLTEPGVDIIGLDPFERFSLGLRCALEAHPDAEAIVISGDLAHHGAPGEYARLRLALQNCPLPVHLMLGNHDRRAPFTAAFPEAATAQGYVQDDMRIGPWHILMLDTLADPLLPPEDPLHHAGALCAKRRAWLDQKLAEPGEKIVIAHHPPMPLGFDGMDEIALQDGDWLIERLIAARTRQLICGHVHRTISGQLRGLPYMLFKGTCHQQPFTLGPGSSHDSVDEPGAYGLMLLSDDQIVLHTEDFTLPRQEARLF